MSLFSRLFGRKRAIEDRRQSNNWKAGDLAVCVQDDWLPDIGVERIAAPAIGEVRRVRAVADVTFKRGVREYALNLETYGDSWMSCFAFRKAVEDTEPAEAEFTALIKRPVKKPVRA